MAGHPLLNALLPPPAEILPNGDGRLLRWTKEVKIPGLVGREIGAGLLPGVGAYHPTNNPTWTPGPSRSMSTGPAAVVPSASTKR